MQTESKPLSLKEAKDKVAQNHNSKDWNSYMEFHVVCEADVHEIAEFYMLSNTEALRKEIELLKAQKAAEIAQAFQNGYNEALNRTESEFEGLRKENEDLSKQLDAEGYGL